MNAHGVYDALNGAFEAAGAFMLTLNVRRLYRDKKVRGVDWRAYAVFAGWGYWNLLYYSSLDQWFSLAAGALTAAVNTAWVAMALYYIKREKSIGRVDEAQVRAVQE